ncbi:MAG TPA: VOC family protein, partial [Candidatus Cybelea sp.]|nr:VOC family protein [Candidatus Cybelea sp.]
MNALDRRRFLMTLPGLALAQQAFAQYPAGRIRIAAFNHVSLNVSDLKRSTEFYQGLFGMPIQSRQGATSVQLRIGAGPQFLNLSGAGASPGIDHMCVGVEGFDVTRVLKVLADHGVAKSDQRGAMKVQVTRRGPDEGGAKE